MRVHPALAVVLLAACLDGTAPTTPTASREAVPLSGPPVLLVAGDIAGCPTDYRDEQTAALLEAEPTATVIPLGDLVYGGATLPGYLNCYHSSWGRFKARSLPVLGNHDYEDAAGAGYYDYFNGVGVDSGPAGHRARGYYAQDIGSWRVYVINSEVVHGSAEALAQIAWLKADLAANPRACVMAAYHRPWFTSSSSHAPRAAMKPVTAALIAAGADVALTSHNHHYERFDRQTLDGIASPAGIRAFVVGTGGHRSLYGFLNPPRANSQVRARVWGVLRLTLNPGSYDWRFLPIAGQTSTDAGSTPCSGASSTPPPPPTRTISLKVSGEIRADGKTYSTLLWSGALGVNVNVIRNTTATILQLNDGRYTNSLTYRGPVTYSYQVCELAPSTICSNKASVTYR